MKQHMHQLHALQVTDSAQKRYHPATIIKITYSSSDTAE